MACACDTGFEVPGLYKLHELCPYSIKGTCAPCEKARKLESKIAEVRALLSDLMEDHRKVRTEMNYAHNPIILQVPPEITSVIFRFANEVPGDFVPYTGRHWKMSYSSQLTLGAVCRGWRDRVASTPQLWTIIVACLNNPKDWQNTFVQTCLTRSGGLPLSVNIYSQLHSYYSPEALVYADRLIALVNQHSNRWESLFLDMPGEYMAKVTGNSSDISAFRNLTLKSMERRALFQMQNVLPKPIHVKLQDRLLNSVVIEWEDVEEASICDNQLDECLELLRIAPNLRNLHFGVIPDIAGPLFPIPTTTIVCTALHELDVHFYDVIACLGFFDKVNLPSLRKLAICLTGDSEPLQVETLLSFFRRSSCSLQELGISNFDCEHEDLLNLLRALPTLKIFKVFPMVNGNFDQNTILYLLGQPFILSDTPGNNEPEVQDEPAIVLPHLQFIEFETSHSVDWSLLCRAFGSLDTNDTPTPTRRRPVRSIHLHILTEATRDVKDIIQKETVPDLLGVLKAGYDLKIERSVRKSDLIKEAMSVYGISYEGQSPVTET